MQVNYAKGYKKLNGPHIDLNSTYTHGFRGKSGDIIERLHPEDELKTGGPFPLLTTYTS